MALELSDFKLQRITFEVRYDNAFLLWDRAGTVAHQLRRRFPALKLEAAPQPNQQTLSLTPDIQTSLTLDRSFIVHVYPEHALEELRAAADALFPLLISNLELSDLTRIGMRTFYEKKFESKDDVARFWASALPMFSREGEFFGVSSGRALDPEIHIRWEGDTTGCSVRATSQDQRLNVSIPREFSDFPSIETKRTVAVLDIDYYAHGNTPVSKFKASSIIENWTKMIRRDLGRFLDVRS